MYFLIVSIEESVKKEKVNTLIKIFSFVLLRYK